ncbi:MAG: hypothetical protein D8H98_05910 [Prevotella sp.]|nr:MAG: hypothetical protein D8H98_05910 [Prevotella sp.]
MGFEFNFVVIVLARTRVLTPDIGFVPQGSGVIGLAQTKVQTHVRHACAYTIYCIVSHTLSKSGQETYQIKTRHTLRTALTTGLKDNVGLLLTSTTYKNGSGWVMKSSTSTKSC